MCHACECYHEKRHKRTQLEQKGGVTHCGCHLSLCTKNNIVLSIKKVYQLFMDCECMTAEHSTALELGDVKKPRLLCGKPVTLLGWLSC